MNYMIYAKHNQNDKRYSPIDLREGTYKCKLAFATLIPDQSKAIGYADKLAEACKEYSFQVRMAGKSTIIYHATQKTGILK